MSMSKNVNCSFSALVVNGTNISTKNSIDAEILVDSDLIVQKNKGTKSIPVNAKIDNIQLVTIASDIYDPKLTFIMNSDKGDTKPIKLEYPIMLIGSSVISALCDEPKTLNHIKIENASTTDAPIKLLVCVKASS